MRTNLGSYREYQVFLNYPFDDGAYEIGLSLHFAVAAAGLIPVCALDLSVPDQPRIEVLTNALQNCKYSAHDLSRVRGEGEQNLARFNMPVELGMALFYSFLSQRAGHRCAFLVPSPFEYRAVVSDLAGLDPFSYRNPDEIVTCTYEWLTGFKDVTDLAKARTSEFVKECYAEFRGRLQRASGGPNGKVSHRVFQEIIYRVCAEAGLWEWRTGPAGRIAFPEIPVPND
jgi:hypothetical protein